MNRQNILRLAETSLALWGNLWKEEEAEARATSDDENVTALPSVPAEDPPEIRSKERSLEALEQVSRLLHQVLADPKLARQLEPDEIKRLQMVEEWLKQGMGEPLRLSKQMGGDISLSVKAIIKGPKGELVDPWASATLMLKDAYGPWWDLPGGHVQEGETLVEALRREVKEETGLDLLVIREREVRMLKLNVLKPVVFYDAVASGPITLSEEHTSYRFFDDKELSEINLGVFRDVLLPQAVDKAILVPSGEDVSVLRPSHETVGSSQVLLEDDEPIKKGVPVGTPWMDDRILDAAAKYAGMYQEQVARMVPVDEKGIFQAVVAQYPQVNFPGMKRGGDQSFEWFWLDVEKNGVPVPQFDIPGREGQWTVQSWMDMFKESLVQLGMKIASGDHYGQFEKADPRTRIIEEKGVGTGDDLTNPRMEASLDEEDDVDKAERAELPGLFMGTERVRIIRRGNPPAHNRTDALLGTNAPGQLGQETILGNNPSDFPELKSGLSPHTEGAAAAPAVATVNWKNTDWQVEEIEKLLSDISKQTGPPRPGLVPQTGDPQHPGRWVRPEEQAKPGSTAPADEEGAEFDPIKNLTREEFNSLQREQGEVSELMSGDVEWGLGDQGQDMMFAFEVFSDVFAEKGEHGLVFRGPDGQPEAASVYSIQEDSLYVDKLGTRPKNQQWANHTDKFKGAGTQAISMLAKEAVDQGLSSVTLMSRQASVPFYQKLGFELLESPEEKVEPRMSLSGSQLQDLANLTKGLDLEEMIAAEDQYGALAGDFDEEQVDKEDGGAADVMIGADVHTDTFGGRRVRRINRRRDFKLQKGIARPATRDMQVIYKDFTKGGERENQFIVAGYASPVMIDLEGHKIEREALEKDLPRFMADGGKYANVNVMHSNVTVGRILPEFETPDGRVYKTQVDDVGLFVVAEVRTDPAAPAVCQQVIEDIEKGHLKSFSISGNADNPVFTCDEDRCFYSIRELQLFEITIALAPGTKVCVPGGEKSIEEVEPGDLVITHKRRARRVTSSGQVAWEGPLIRVTLDDGRELLMTPEHKVRIWRQGHGAWELPVSLKPGDEVVEGFPNRRGKTVASGDLGALAHQGKVKGITKEQNPSLTGGIRTEEGRAIQRAAVTSPKFKLARSLAQRRKWQEPEYRERMERVLAGAREKIRSDEGLYQRWFQAINGSSRFVRGRLSGPEALMVDLLETSGLGGWRYTGGGGHVVAGKFPDFWNGGNKVLEVYGRYWHRDDDPQDRIDLFKRHGYDCIVIWDDELKGDPARVMEQVAEFTWR